ncbi:hypothetical protein [Thalassotalea ganghwensis]
MKKSITIWWKKKTAQEKADFESSFVLIISTLSFLPALLIVSL